MILFSIVLTLLFLTIYFRSRYIKSMDYKLKMRGYVRDVEHDEGFGPMGFVEYDEDYSVAIKSLDAEFKGAQP